MSLSKAIQAQGKALLDELDEEERAMQRDVTDRFRSLRHKIEQSFDLDRASPDASIQAPAATVAPQVEEAAGMAIKVTVSD